MVVIMDNTTMTWVFTWSQQVNVDLKLSLIMERSIRKLNWFDNKIKQFEHVWISFKQVKKEIELNWLAWDESIDILTFIF